MEKTINKRKIRLNKALEVKKRYIKIKKVKQKNIIEPIGPFVQVKVEKKKSKMVVSSFQLVVVKIPWYRRAIRSFMGWFGYYG